MFAPLICVEELGDVVLQVGVVVAPPHIIASTGACCRTPGQTVTPSQRLRLTEQLRDQSEHVERAVTALCRNVRSE